MSTDKGYPTSQNNHKSPHPAPQPLLTIPNQRHQMYRQQLKQQKLSQFPIREVKDSQHINMSKEPKLNDRNVLIKHRHFSS